MRSTAAYEGRWPVLSQRALVSAPAISPRSVMSKNKGGREVRKPKQPKKPKAGPGDSAIIPPTKQARK
jgi:hypothetical protein